jgi:hypothetical protein
MGVEPIEDGKSVVFLNAAQVLQIAATMAMWNTALAERRRPGNAIEFKDSDGRGFFVGFDFDVNAGVVLFPFSAARYVGEPDHTERVHALYDLPGVKKPDAA